MTREELEALARRRAEEQCSSADYNLERSRCFYFLSGALDPVLEEARRAEISEELWLEAASRVEVRSDGRVHDICVDFREFAQAEREKLKKLLAGS